VFLKQYLTLYFVPPISSEESEGSDDPEAGPNCILDTFLIGSILSVSRSLQATFLKKDVLFEINQS
jgi:hypothetical protein